MIKTELRETAGSCQLCPSDNHEYRVVVVAREAGVEIRLCRQCLKRMGKAARELAIECAHN